ncbi:MAG: hypothetical protein PHH19_05475 [Eubacteriales bacterium]|jgi:hypothetical protein|nr:hypothetical protein [Eubacteriales bacterium]
MKKTELLTFIILSMNFIVTGLVIERPGIFSNTYVFVPLAFLTAYALTKYVFYISKNMGRGDKK